MTIMLSSESTLGGVLQVTSTIDMSLESISAERYPGVVDTMETHSIIARNTSDNPRHPPPQGKTIRSAPVAGLDSRGFSPLWKPDLGESEGGAILARPQKWPFLLILRVKSPKMRVLRLRSEQVAFKPAIAHSAMLISLCTKLIR
jgi:hypothetical protein